MDSQTSCHFRGTRAPFSRLLLLMAAGLLLAACNPNFDFDARHLKPLSAATENRLETLGMEAGAPMVVRIFKEEETLEVWLQRKDENKYALYKKYDICAYSGILGPKIKEGDRQAPEGFYTIVPGLMNPRSNYYLAFNLGFPNAFDQAHGRTGSHLMVHGSCSSRGCYAMEDDQIEEIYQLGRESFNAGQRSFQVQAFPFRLTEKNLKRHRRSEHIGFWRNLKDGYDHFEAMKQPPKVNVCGRQYVFNAIPAAGTRFVAQQDCPEYRVPEAIGRAVAKHRGETYVPQTPIALAGMPSVTPRPAAAALLRSRVTQVDQSAVANTTTATSGVSPVAETTAGPIWIEPAPAQKQGFFSRLFRR